MSTDRISLLSRSFIASMTVCLAAGAMCLWTTGIASDAGGSTPAPAAVLVSVSLLDMSRLAPAQFGDWESAVSQQAK